MQPATFARNKDGVALVTALCMTLISLTIVMAVMYVITQGIIRTGTMKTYRTALEASYGGTDIVIKEIVPALLRVDTGFLDDLNNKYSMNFMKDTTDACLNDKLTKRTADWDPACSQSLDLRADRDFSFTLQASAGQPYSIYTKVIDTISGNTDTSGLQLEGAGVAESTSVLTPQHLPYVYRVEVQGERSQNAVERANLTVLYAY